LAGDGARVAPAKEAARTKAWRFIRRCTARCRTSLGSPASQDDGFEPAKVVEIELSQPLPAITPISIAEGLEVGSHTRTCARALIYAQLFGQPIGAVELTLPDAGLGAAGVADRLWFHLHDTILMRLAEEGLPGITELDISGVRTTEKPKSQKDYESFLAHAPFVSVIVPTHNRPDRIVNALHQLLAQDYPRFEIIVVDNAPRDDQTAAAIQQQFGHVSQVRYVHEPMAGLSRARNCGFRIARGEFAAFPDDDLIYGRRWLSHLIQGFYAADDVGCVAGLILPAELETRAQLWLEQYGGFSKGFARRIFDLHEHRPADRLFPYTSGSCGSGANTAVKASVLREIGGFDETLSTGTPAFGGEDLALFFDVLTHGHAVVYEPAAVSYHPHAREYAALKRQMYGYGAGLTAYLTRCLLNKPSRIFEIAMRAPQGIAFALSPSSKKNACKQTGYPKELTRAELRGMAYGPIAYWRSVRRARMVRAKASISQPKLEREYARVHARVHEHTHE
jgi:glycosyltransferase involved in cell wall biosynthesis